MDCSLATNLNRPAVTQRRVCEGDRLMAGLETSRETAQIEDMVLCSACSPQAGSHRSKDVVIAVSCDRSGSI